MKLNRFISLCTALILSCSATAFNVSAEAISSTHCLIAAMSNCKVYYSPTYASSYGERTMSSANAWANNINLKFNMKWSKTSTSSDATAQCSYYRNANEDILAYTTYFYGSNSTHPTSSNWTMCKIKLNLAYNVRNATIIHEFGHVFGLGDNNGDPSSIMCQNGSGRTATSPSKSDVETLNQLYPNAF